VKLLVTGGSGLLGTNLLTVVNKDHQTYASYLRQPPPQSAAAWIELDIRDSRAVRLLLRKLSPDLVVHAAALADIDYCEKHPAAAEAVNHLGTCNVAAAAAEIGAKLIYISTDYVFDGLAGDYREDATPVPVNVYGATKLNGEAAVQRLSSNWNIVRTTFFGWSEAHPHSYFPRLLARLRNGESVVAAPDAYFSPLPVRALSRAILELGKAGPTGIYHLGSPERCSRYEFAVKTAAAFDLSPGLIRPVPFAALPGAVPRPRDTSLNSSRARSLLVSELPRIDAGLKLTRRLIETKDNCVQG